MYPLKKPNVHLLALETGHLSSEAISGGDVLLEKMVPFLAKKFKISVIVPKIGVAHWKKYKNVKIYTLPKNPFDESINKFAILFSYILRSLQSYLLLRKLKFDMLYSSTHILPDVLPAYFLKIKNPKTFWVARVHHLISEPGIRPGNFLANLAAFKIQTLLLKAASKADLVIALNSQLARKLEGLDISSAKVQVLGAGIDLKKIKATKAEKKLYDGIFVGRLHQTKGVYDLVKIWKKVTSILPEAKLAIVGEARPQITKELTEIIKLENLTKNIFIFGYLPERKLYETLKKSRVFLFTDHEAGFGIAVAEAMAAGCPVVGWDIGILGSVYQSGFLKVPFGNFNLFAQKILKVLQDKKLSSKLSREAKIEATKFDWSNISKKFIQILDEVLLFVQKK